MIPYPVLINIHIVSIRNEKKDYLLNNGFSKMLLNLNPIIYCKKKYYIAKIRTV